MEAIKITKKEFVNAMVGSTTIFCGLTNCFDPQKIGTAINDWKSDVIKKGFRIYNRSAYARSKDIVFSDGSHLFTSGMHFYKIDTGSCIAYIARHYVEDDVYGTYDKSMVYIIDWREQV